MSLLTNVAARLRRAPPEDGLGRSPYLNGAGIGLLSGFAFATMDRGLGATSPFEAVAALTMRRVAPDATHINDYVKAADEPPGIGWDTFLVAGIVAGSFLAAKRARERPPRGLPKTWRARFGKSRGKRAALAFLGGATMMFGARMAKGCTSGHAITGALQLATSSLVFTPLMFGTAALVSRALYGKGSAKGAGGER